MSVIKKVLANVVQTLTRSEQTTAKKNIGLGDTAHQPPVDPMTISAGGLVWDPNHTGVYRLLENWSYSTPWASITKKVRVMPSPENDPLRIDLTVDKLNENVPGLTALINAILSFGKPYILLDLGNDSKVAFQYTEFSRQVSSSSHSFRAWQENSTKGKLDFLKITVTNLDNVNYNSWSVNL